MRSLDVAHVSFADSGRLSFEIKLPESVTSIDSAECRVLNTNTTGVGTYVPSVELWYQDTGVWTQIGFGSTFSAATDTIRLLVEMEETNNTSPVVCGFTIEY